MNKLDLLFTTKKENILTIYATAGFPNLDDTPKVVKALDKAGVDIIEIGVPYSDPLADGPIIQQTSEKALQNGMKLDLLFEQMNTFRDEVSAPYVLMGYYNQVLKYGLEKFLSKCLEAGVSGLILPDMPFEIYLSEHKNLFEKYDQKVVFLITPQTNEERIQQIVNATTGFVYIVSNSATTGTSNGTYNEEFLNRIANLKITKPKLIGFGIATHQDYKKANQFADGAIIGSAFLKMLDESENLNQDIKQFVHNIKEEV